jgi:ribosomal-protein-alanine N-acetyltransferase
MASLEARAFKKPWLAPDIQGELGRSFTLAMGYLTPEALLAYFLAWILPPDTHLLRLCVQPERQGLGLAAQLLRLLVEISQKKKCQTILVEVAVDNYRARRFYQMAGFIQNGRSKRYYDEVDGLRLSLDLSQWPGIRPASPSGAE